MNRARTNLRSTSLIHHLILNEFRHSEMILASPFRDPSTRPERLMGDTSMIRRLIWTGVRILESMIHQLLSGFFESHHARNGGVTLREQYFFATVPTIEFVLANRLIQECVQSTDSPDIAGIDGPACQMPAASPSQKRITCQR